MYLQQVESSTVPMLMCCGLDVAGGYPWNADKMLRKASEARVNRRLRRYYLIVRLLPNVFALACLPLSSI